MSNCTDTALETGTVSLFCGVETANWHVNDFLDVAQFALAHNIKTLFIKVFEVGSNIGDSSGMWYGGLEKWDSIYKALQPIINVIPYGFLWGTRIDLEAAISITLLQRYNKLCLDIEGNQWVGDASAAKALTLANALQKAPGRVWLSYPANFRALGLGSVISALVRCTDVFMPMAYSDNLASLAVSVINSVNPASCVQPTLDLSQEFGPNNVLNNVDLFIKQGCPAISLWYEGFAKGNPTLIDNIVTAMGGNHLPVGVTALILNKDGCVCDVTRSFQLETEEFPNVPGTPPGTVESEDLCGPWSVASLKYAGPPTQGSLGSTEDIDRWTDNEADKWWGKHTGTLGSMTEDMHNFLHDAGMHYWDMPTPDVNAIRLAIQAGYPVLVAAPEKSIIEKRTMGIAYPWSLDASHIIPLCGIDKDGDFISYDELNNAFQGYWPPVYLASRLNPSWATIVQLVGPDATNPWLKPIPTSNPRDKEWLGFNAQNYKEVPTLDFQLLAATTVWGAVRKDCPFNSGFANEWMKAYRQGDFKGPPLTQEFDSVNWQGAKGKVQVFPKGQYETFNGQIKWYPY